MTSRALISVNRDVKKGLAVIQTECDFIAVRSESLDAIPFIPWTVLEIDKSNLHQGSSDTILVNPAEFGATCSKPENIVIWHSVTPVVLSHIVLIATAENFVKLSSSKEQIKSKLPKIVRANSYLSDLGCYVAACEPVDQGVLPQNYDFTISVVESDIPSKNDNEMEGEVNIVPFLSMNAPSSNRIEIETAALSRPILVSDILPVVPLGADLENIGFVHLSELAKLGVFSGDLVKITCASVEQERYIFLHSHPDSNASKGTIFFSPMFLYNLGSPSNIVVEKITEMAPKFEYAKDVTLSRVNSAASSNKANQAAFLQGLKSYFTNRRSNVVANNDLIAVTIDSNAANLAFSTLGNSEDEDIDVQSIVFGDSSKADTVIWFQVNGLPSNSQYIISPNRTRMVQSGVAQQLAPSTKLKWKKYFGLRSNFNYFNSPNENDFKYAKTLCNLLKSSLTPRGAVLKTTILLKSSKRGVGKSTVIQSVADFLGIHTMVMDANDLIGDSDSKTLGLFKARLERATTINQCLVLILHFESLARKNDLDGKDTPLVNGVVDLLNEFTSQTGLIISATVNDPDVLSDSVRMRFKFEVDVTVPTESERIEILKFLTSEEGGFNESTSLVSQINNSLCDGFNLRGDISVDSLALQSAGLTPLDLLSIVDSSKLLAMRRATEDTILCSLGKVKIIPDDVNRAVSDARDKFSDSIGAPKIPNVAWKDVGGLDMVKGEILDVIDMPLKHPELFASGLKKRSGILFYGPPGTGKTLLAKAIATNFSLNFFSVKGPELLNMYIGESEANVRRIFQKARDAKPCVVFFDELDSVAPKRGNKGDSGGVMDRIVSQLLAELDGMNSSGDGVFCVGATNRPDLLDEALLRPGRFDKMLYLGVSDTHDKQRTILEALTRKFDLSDDVDLSKVAENCPFTYTGADFYALSSDAMLNAMTRTAGEIDKKVLEYNESNPQSPITVKKWFQSIATPEDINVRVSAVDFDKALQELIPSVSANELQHYLNVRRTFEGGN